jgi:DNA adenine methylase
MLGDAYEIELTKPILKWAGGKSKVIDKLIVNFPTDIETYHEIFLGGGSMLFAVLNYADYELLRIKQYCAYDINKPLIYMYKNIQKRPRLLYSKLIGIITEFSYCKAKDINRNPETLTEAMSNKENYYYWIRKKYNSMPDSAKITTDGSAMFIFLNKTCFRGLYREGPNGFNVPYGNYKNPQIIDFDHLMAVSKLIKNVVFKCLDFTKSMQLIEPGDFAYLDPPYAPANNKSFVQYSRDGFPLESHNQLIEMIKKLKTFFVMSNANVPLITNNFTESNFRIQTITCGRAINSKNPESTAEEVIISNIKCEQ